MLENKPKKLQRASRACDFCHKRSVKCAPSSGESPKCQNCVDFAVECTYTRPWKRARTSTNVAAASNAVQENGTVKHEQQCASVAGSSAHSQLEIASNPDRQYGSPTKVVHDLGPDLRTTQPPPRHRLGEAWKAFVVASEHVIYALIDVYFAIVYPIFPLYHRGRLEERMKQGEYLTNRGFFSTLMAACALASARARDGAASWYSLAPSVTKTSAETFYLAALDGIPKELSSARGLDYLRACALMAVASIQLGRIESLHEYLGQYHALMAVQRFHDEAYWPRDMIAIEREELRRLVWSMYTLDVWSSIVWNSPLRSKCGQLSVAYPSEVEDDLMSSGQDSLSNPNCWLHGWNFTIDLYRVLQQSIDELRFRRNAIGARLRPVPTLSIPQPVSGSEVMLRVYQTYASMPAQFKTPPSASGRQANDIFGFQFANIQATLALLQIILFTTEAKVNVEKKCDVASDLISTFQRVPLPYLQAISTPLIYHLAGIGNILSSALEDPLCDETYQNVRAQILSMADLLDSLELNLHRAAGLGKGMRNQVERLDLYMHGQQRVPYSRPFQNTVADITTTANIPNVAISSSNVLPNASLSQFQLPPELLEDWPWPFDVEQNYGIFPLPFD
ncbi:MAG: hypothetical protein M1820_009233 [Bogoriella megaspora]|nr:MAG: hypothetical protein M1820_009233 [Bogoriella megaspora]